MEKVEAGKAERHNKLNNRESFHLAQILAKEEFVQKFISYFQNELNVLALEKQTIFKVYGIPLNQEIDFNENTNEVTYEDKKSDSK